MKSKTGISGVNYGKGFTNTLSNFLFLISKKLLSDTVQNQSLIFAPGISIVNSNLMVQK